MSAKWSVAYEQALLWYVHKSEAASGASVKLQECSVLDAHVATARA